jgi:DMSO/TMAO reductase YedYZ molybdopterin-dependent catalytic subunit
LYRSSVATLAGLLIHYGFYYAFGTPLWTEVIAEWIMAHTPSKYAVALLTGAGAWAKPLAMTGGLATLGFFSLILDLLSRLRSSLVAKLVLTSLGALVIASLAASFFEYRSLLGQLSFWIPVVSLLSLMPSGSTEAGFSTRTRSHVPSVSRRQAIAQTLAMTGGTVAVALESYARNEALASKAVATAPLPPAAPVIDRAGFAPGLVRKAVNTVEEFYGMSKNAVDPVLDPKTWRLKITQDGKLLRELTYQQLLSLPRTERFQTLRCISNTLKSDLMNTAHWSGISFGQIIDRAQLAPNITEMAVIGVDGHGDSFRLDYAFSDEPMLALAMNGRSLNRTHGFPLRLLVPRYYGFKNIKWIGEIAFVSKPYFGTWPKMGYTKEPEIHTMSFIDRYRREGDSLRAGGVAFAGIRGIRAVQVRADSGPWVDAVLEEPLSGFTWTRWHATLPVQSAELIESRAQDGSGRWQATEETPLFPNGVQGPTRRPVRT